jgi:tetratricopeptide (TPR) repeat protein/transcriptional regulator with XRE-family HTH domain
MMVDAQQMSLGRRLLRERESHHWTQEQLAKKIGCTALSINRWENDRTSPRPDMINLLIEAFAKPPERWGMGILKHWNIPYSRNPYFTERGQILLNLHKILGAENSVLSQTLAICGLGGMGKTQTTIEYAYRYANEYEAVLWVGADSRETLVSDFAKLAQTLDLREKEETDQFRMIAAVKLWLQKHRPWLLIFDNADELAVVSDFLPRQASGATLLTTRSQITGPHIKKTEMEKMSQEEGVTFLLRRITSSGDEEDPSKKVSDIEQRAAQKLWEAMDGLPLALDQAGAYIEAAQCSLTDYLNLYRHHPNTLLQERGGPIPEHPDAVATTWDLSFQRVEQKNPAAAELLRFCSFLSPDAIPEELITRGAAHFTSPLQAVAASTRLLDKAISTLRAYSLVKRDPTAHMLSIHRLVQAVLQDMLDEKESRSWAKRVILAVNAAFPHPEHDTWSQCERLMSHALLAAQYIERQQITSEEAGRLLHETASYLRDRARYSEAEPLYQRALRIRERHLGPEHLDLADPLNGLAELYRQQGKYEQAEPLFLRALSIREQHLGTEHPDTARNLNNLAILYWQQSKYEQAEPLFQRALSIYEQHLGADHLDTARSLNGLANLCQHQRKYEQAEALYQRVLSIWEQHLGVDHPYTASCRNNLAELYRQQGKYEQAAPMFQRVLAIFEQQLGPQHPDTARSLNNLAELYRQQGKYEQAEPLFLRALSIYEQHLVADHLDTAESLHGLAKLYQQQGKYEQAEALYQRALAIRKQRLGPTHPETQDTQKDYTVFLGIIRRDAEATVLDTSHEP